jgi:hypothetical protein
MTDDEKKGGKKKRHPFWMWFVGTSFGRRVALTVLLGTLMAMTVWIVRRGGLAGNLQTTVVFWSAFLIVLMSIVGVAIIDMLMVRLRFIVAHRHLVKKTFAGVEPPQDENDSDETDIAKNGG